MNYAQFSEALFAQIDAAPEIPLEHDARVVILSDLHAGDGSARDDLARNGALLLALLERHYLPRGSTLILNGDVEELQKYRLSTIRAAWPGLYGLFDRFSEAGGLFKILGNHDEALELERSYPYPLYHGLSLRSGKDSLYVVHGHQASHFYANFNRLSGALVKYVVRTLGLPNLNVSRNPRRKFKIERRFYRFCQENKLVAVIGHTHRPLFESLSKYDALRFAIERLCREYPLADEVSRLEIAAALADYKEEFGRLRRRERRGDRGLGLYGRELLLPCLFNSGCAVGKKGITALEIEDGKIELVYWYEVGKMRRYLERESARAFPLDGTPYRRVVINSDRLDYLFARIGLLA